MILLDLSPELLAKAQPRMEKDGWDDLPTLIRVLLTRYAYYQDAGGGGHVRAKNMTAAARSKAASTAAAVRWAGSTPEERKANSQRATEASLVPKRAALALLRKLLMPTRRVPCWPLDESEE